MDSYGPDIAALFHLHSSYDENVLPDGQDPDAFPGWATIYPGAPRIALPAPHPLGLPLHTVLSRRRTVRRFRPGRLPLASLAGVLTSAAGVSRREGAEAGEPAERRPYPSAGALYPLELHVLTSDVEGLADGHYHFDPRAGELETLRLGRWQEALTACTLGHAVLAPCNLVVAVVGVPARTMTKYGQRGYRFMLLDAGHVAQTLCLVACALDLGALTVGGFYDGPLHRMLGLGDAEWPLLLVGVGRPDSSSPPAGDRAAG